ncbi:MAG: long-chain fatty acid--CoA ligase [Actinomycetes bacterium]
MLSTMMDAPLTITEILKFGIAAHAQSKVITVSSDGFTEATFAEVGERSAQLAHVLAGLGVGDGDRVGTFLWNNQTHQEAYLAIPCMGAVLHTLNIRLYPEQLAYVINHGGDKVIIVDNSLLPLLARVAADLTTVEQVIIAGGGSLEGPWQVHDYEALLAGQPTSYDWPAIDERSAAAMCYTSGTTGNPKGVVYSHRSTYLHSIAQTSASSIGIVESDRVLAIVPMFHANAWGLPYSAWLAGADLLMPQQLLQGEPLVAMIEAHRPSVACGVPTVWNDVLRVAGERSADLSSLRCVTAGGSAVPRNMIEAFEEQFGVPIIQGWGMTETSPLASIAIPPHWVEPQDAMDYRVKAGRVVFGVEVRITDDDGSVLAHDGEAVGEFEIRGPWVTASYYQDPDPEKFRDGWLRTGDVGTLDGHGFMTISDRTKDVIKSGGEWISSVELEGEVMAHGEVFEAAVVAVPDERWQERPLCCVVRQPNSQISAEDLIAFLGDRVAKWWLPERWTFIDAIPKTSVGKFDKKVLRAQYADGELDIIALVP